MSESLTFLDFVPAVSAMIAVAVALGAYVRFLLLRANVGAMFDVEYSPLGTIDGSPVGDLTCLVTNLSSNLLVVTHVRVRVRYTDANERSPQRHGLEPEMTHLLSAEPGAHGAWIDIYPSRADTRNARTVVFPGGTQPYRKPLTFLNGAGVVSVWGSCDYRVHVGQLTQWLVRRVLRPPADLDFTRSGVSNHQVRKTFRIE